MGSGGSRELPEMRKSAVVFRGGPKGQGPERSEGTPFRPGVGAWSMQSVQRPRWNRICPTEGQREGGSPCRQLVGGREGGGGELGGSTEII